MARPAGPPSSAGSSPSSAGTGTGTGSGSAGTGAGGAAAGETETGSDDPRISRLHLWQVQIVRDLLLVGLVVLLVWIGYALRAVTVPLLVALLLAYLFEPVVARISRSQRFSREGAVVAILSTLVAAVIILGGLLTPLVIHQTGQLISFARSGRVERAVEELVAAAPSSPGELFEHIESFLRGGRGEEADEGAAPEDDASSAAAGGADAPEPPPAARAAPAAPAADGPDLLEAFDELLAERGMPPLSAAERARLAEATGASADLPTVVATLDRLLEQREALAAVPTGRPRPAADGVGVDRGGIDFVAILQNSMRRFTGFLGAVLQLGLIAFLIPFYFYFFSASWPRILEFGTSLVPDRHRARTFHLLRRMDVVVAGFVRGRIVISVIMGVMFAIGWWICGVPYAIPVGLIVGIFSAVPYLGGVGIPLAVGLLLFEQLTQPGGRTMSWWLILGGPVAVFAIVQVVESYILTPVIAGKATNLDPVTILVAVLAGGSILGVYGMLLAIPAAACAKILIIEMVLPKVEAWKRGERADPLPLDR